MTVLSCTVCNANANANDGSGNKINQQKDTAAGRGGSIVGLYITLGQQRRLSYLVFDYSEQRSAGSV